MKECNSVDEIKQRRNKESKQILDTYFALIEEKVNKSDEKLRKAMKYSLDRKEKASAIIFSIIQTARANGLNIFNYLQKLFIKLPNTPISEIDKFLPWNK